MPSFSTCSTQVRGEASEWKVEEQRILKHDGSNTDALLALLNFSTLLVLSLAISTLETVTVLGLFLRHPAHAMDSVKDATATHGLGFSAGNIYLLGAEIFLWICPPILGLNWRLLRLVLSNMTVWSVPYWFIAGTTVGAISDFWACSERVRNKRSYSGAGINKREGRQYGTGEEKVCIQKLSSIKVKVCHSLKELYNIRFRLKKIFLCLPQVKTKQEHPRIQIFFSLYNMKWSRNRKSINSVVFWFLCCMERISSTISQKKWKDRLRFAELLKKARLLNSLSRLYISFQKVYKLFLL